MSFATRCAVFLTVAAAGFVAWQWNAAIDSSRDVTHLAVRQFDNNEDVASNLRDASLAQNWWPLAWPAILLVLAAAMFWDDLERLWKHEHD